MGHAVCNDPWCASNMHPAPCEAAILHLQLYMQPSRRFAGMRYGAGLVLNVPVAHHGVAPRLMHACRG